MRIVLSCPYSLSRPGGVQGQVRGLARSLRRAGHDVTVLAPDDDRSPGLHDGTLVVGHSVGIRANGSIAPLALSPQSLWRTGRFVRRARPDVVHLHEPLAPASGYGCFLQAGVPLVGTFHRSGESPLYRALGPLGRLAAGRLDAACCVSEAAGETARAMLGVNCEVLFNGVEVDRFARTAPVPHPGPTVLFLGRHEARKGLGILLEAFTRLPPPAVLWVAGDGPLTGALSGAVSEQRTHRLARHARRGGPRRPAGRGRRPLRPLARPGSPSGWSCSRPWPPGRRWWRRT